MIWYNHMITWLYNKIERDSDKTLQTPAKYIRLTQHSHHILFQGPAPRYWLFPPYMSKCLYVWVFICSHVLRGLQTLDIRHWMANTSLHQDTKNNLSSKINFPVTPTTGSKPSLTSYCWTQSLRHSWGGSITNISELDQFIIRAINRGPFHNTIAKAWKINTNLLFPGEPGNRGTEEPRNRGTGFLDSEGSYR